MNSRRFTDHLVGEQKERFRDRKPQRLGGGQVDDEVEFSRLLHRQVGGLGALQNLMHVAGCAPE
jgi:hypothetical protein